MRNIALLVVLVLAPLAANAQQPGQAAAGEDLVDRVIAVVGDTVLLASDIQVEIQQAIAMGEIGNDPLQIERYFDQVLERQINDLILISAARRAGITVQEEQVNSMVELDIQGVIRDFQSEAAFLAALAESGLTRDQYRRTRAEAVRNQMLVGQFVQSHTRNRARPLIDDRDVQAYFDLYSGSLGERPTMVAFRQVVIAPDPAPEARQAAIERAREVLRELSAGGDFEVLARRYSDDLGTAERGGDLGWFGTGRMVPEFERAAFSMRPGQTSGIVETEFGFHIIRLERTRGTERQARHILLRPEITEADIQRAQLRADSAANALREGTSIATIIARYHETGESSTSDRVPLEALPPEYSRAIGSAGVGATIGPLRVEDPRGDRWIILRLTERLESGPATVDDFRDRIVQLLQDQKMLEQLLEELRDQVHVSVLL